MSASQSPGESGCPHESVQLFGRVDAAGCGLAALRCVNCGRLLHGEGSA